MLTTNYTYFPGRSQEPDLETLIHSDNIIEQLELFDDLPVPNVERNSMRPYNKIRKQPHWRYVFSQLHDERLSLEEIRQRHNAAFPSRAYSHSRFIVKFRKKVNNGGCHEC